MVIIEVCHEAAGISANTFSPDQPQTTHSVFTLPPETLSPPLQDMPAADVPVVNGISTLEEQDVEERLEQLLLQDDLTDARIEEMANTTLENRTNETNQVTAESHPEETDEVKEEEGDQGKEERQQDGFQFPNRWVCLFWAWPGCITMPGLLPGGRAST